MRSIPVAVFLASIITFGHACSSSAQSNQEWIAFKAKCGLPANLDYNSWVANGPPCKSGAAATSAPDATAPSNSAAQSFMTGFNRALANAQAQQQLMLRNANAAADINGIANANGNEQQENAIQANELSRHQAQISATQSDQTASFSNQRNSANQLLQGMPATATFVPAITGTPQQQKAWSQLHCMAYLSSIAFDDLALGDITNYHDIRAEASKAYDGSQTGTTCPASPPMPDLRGNEEAAFAKVENRLTDDLKQADQIAARLQKTTYQPDIPATATVSDPKLAATIKAQQALNALAAAKNPYTDPSDFAQFEKDRKNLKQSIQDSSNAASGNFGSLQVDLGSATP